MGRELIVTEHEEIRMYTLESVRYQKELNGAASLAHLAGSVMLHYYDLDYRVFKKEGEDRPEGAILTEVDGKIDGIVRNYFKEIWPDDQLLTEETAPDRDWYKARRIWMVDPIDGTMGYRKKTGSFGFSIALIEDGRPVLGVLHAPVKNLTAWAVKGEGAHLNGIKVNLREDTPLSTVLCSSNSIHRPAYEKALARINPEQNLNILTAESAVVKALLVLQGKGQIYPILPISDENRSGPKFWDIAAADIILHEAGAIVTTFFGEKYRYNVPDFRCVGGVLMGTKSAHHLTLSRLQRESLQA